MCENLLSSYFFGKNSVKATHLSNELLKSWFDEIFQQWEYFYSVEITGIRSQTHFWQKFREINSFSK